MAYKPHPERFAATRSYAQRLLAAYHSSTSPHGPTPETIQAVMGELFGVYNQNLAGLPLNQRPANTTLLTRELSLFMHYAAYSTAGGHLFRLPAEKADSFSSEPLRDGETVTHNKMPHPSLHLSFGPRPYLDLMGTGNLVDGAYVQWRNKSHPLEILLTTYDKSLNYDRPLNFVRSPDRYYYFSIPLMQGADLKTSLAREIEISKPFEPKTLTDTSGAYSAGRRTIQVEDITRRKATAEAEAARLGFKTFEAALPLVVRSLAWASGNR